MSASNLSGLFDGLAMIPEHPDTATWSAGGQPGKVELHQRETVIQHGLGNLIHIKMIILKKEFTECEFLEGGNRVGGEQMQHFWPPTSKISETRPKLTTAY